MGFSFKNCKNIIISDSKVFNSHTALMVDNSSGIKVNGFQTKNCKKGIVLNECWDSDFRNLNIETDIPSKPVKIKLLSHLIKYYMHK